MKLFPLTFFEYLLYAKYVLGIEIGKKIVSVHNEFIHQWGENIINFDYDNDNRKIFLFSFLL